MWRRAVDRHTIVDLETFVGFMRYNNRSDPLASGDACNGISARCDLNPPSSESFDCFGAIDIKVATSGLFNRTTESGLGFYGNFAPSWGGMNPPFAWSNQGQGCKGTPHAMQPDVFNFSTFTFPHAFPIL